MKKFLKFAIISSIYKNLNLYNVFSRYISIYLEHFCYSLNKLWQYDLQASRPDVLWYYYFRARNIYVLILILSYHVLCGVSETAFSITNKKHAESANLCSTKFEESGAVYSMLFRGGSCKNQKYNSKMRPHPEKALSSGPGSQWTGHIMITLNGWINC